jgi:intracellular septation protein A
MLYMKTLYVLAVAEAVALALSKFMQLHDAITYTIVGMMIVTFGYLFENLLADKKSFPHRRKIIVASIFAVVLLVYWLLKFI